jgi:subtilisin family serine protease
VNKYIALLSLAILVLWIPSLTQPTIASVTLIPTDPSSSSHVITVLIVSRADLSFEQARLLSDYGTLTTIAGPVAILHTRSSLLHTLSGLPFVSRIERSHSLGVYLDQSVPDIGASMVWDEVKDPYGRNVTGAGVVVGFVDTGIDTTHPDFSFPNGTSKILYVWDQTLSGRPPTGFDYGYECTTSDLQARICPEEDTFGHGTHVAGIAASSGKAIGNYTGVAPGAEIIFVKSGGPLCDGQSWYFSTDQILDGVNYIVGKAAQLGRRAVINLSLGGNIGAHDGSDPLELGLEAIVRAGTPVVIAAGNSAQDNSHIKGRLSLGQSVTISIELKATSTDLVVDAWYSPQDQFDATIATPDGETFSLPTPQEGVTSKVGNITAFAGLPWAPSPVGNELYFEVNSTTQLPPSGWSIKLTANQVNSGGIWDAWVDTNSCESPGASFLAGNGYQIDSHDTIGIPGTAKDVVTVGAYITKTSWRGESGNTLGNSQAHTGGIAPFSSWGPTRDGRVKPDVVAPGMYIASARSSATPLGNSDPDLYHRVEAGTSMATPHVTGTIALMLQYAPNLEAAEIPNILRETARLDSNTGLLESGSPIWGYGKLDARTATGLFRLTLAAEGLPGSVTDTIQIDSQKVLTFSGASWMDLYWRKGSTHAVTIGKTVSGTVDTRYQLIGGTFTVSSNTLKPLKFTVQYLLTVNSRFGGTGSGWYDAGQVATFSAPTPVTAQGILGNLGVEYVLSHWISGDGKAISNSSMKMDRPTNVTAVYQLTVVPMTLAVIIGLVAAANITAIVAIRRRKS